METKLKEKTEWVSKSTQKLRIVEKSESANTQPDWCCVSIYILMLFLDFFLLLLTVSLFRDHHIVYLHKQLSSIFSVVSFSYRFIVSSINFIDTTWGHSSKSDKKSTIHRDKVDAFQFFCYCSLTIQTATYTSLNCIKPFTHRIGYPNGVIIHRVMLSTIIIYSLNQSN